MSRRCVLGLGILLVLAAVLRIACFTGLQVGDDIVYSRITVDRLHGKTDVTNVQQTRSGFLLPLLVSYALFGPGEVPLVLYNLVCSTAMVGAIFWISRRLFGDVGGMLSGLAAAVHPNLVRFASECHTDTPLALWLVLAMAAFHAALPGDPGGRLRILTGLLLGWGYLHKESALYATLFFAGHWVVTRSSWRWYLPVVLPVAGVVLAEMVGFAAVSGRPLARYQLIRYWHAGQYMAERYTSLGSILHRELFELPKLLFTPGYGRNWTGLINLTCLASGLLLLWRRRPGSGYLGGWFLAFYAGYSFWPSSIFPFMPGFFLFEWTLPVLGALLTPLVGGVAAWGRPGMTCVAAATLLVSAGVTLPSTARQGRDLSAGAREARAWIQKMRPARVISDDKTIEALDFFEGHEPSRVYQSFQEAKEYGSSFVIVDRFWSEQGQWWSRPVPDGVLHPPASWEKVYDTGRIAIYRP